MDDSLTRRRFLGGAATGLALASPAWAGSQATPNQGPNRDAREFGATGDGQTDDSPAIQRALDAASKSGGGTVWLGLGAFLLKNPLNVPQGTTLRGSYSSVPANNGLRDAGLPKPGELGTTLLGACGAGREDDPALVTLNTTASLIGLTIYYPGIATYTEPTPHPYAIAMRGKNPAVLDVELLNPYKGIDATQNERHLIRNVHGQPLRTGVWVDSIYDIGRIENVHFNPWFSMQPKLFEWQMANGEAFVFGRTDWQYVFNTFCFGYNVGYRFVESKNGVCNGNFLGIGADDCHTSLVVDNCAPMGLLITNGEFVSFHGPDPTMVDIKETNKGTVRFSTCSFWGPCNQVGKVDGTGTVGFSDCTFVQWDAKKEGRAALMARGSGMFFLRGCSFEQDGTALEISSSLMQRSIDGNLGRGGFKTRSVETA